MLGGKNKQHRQPLGYTIVEVMIVVAVSGFMFVIAANFINGKQAKAAFAQGSNDTVSKFQNIVADVTDGHFSDVPLQCAVSGTGLVANTTATGGQGETPDCVFAGKIIRFYDPSGGSNRNNYSVYSIAAARSVTDFPTDQIAAISGLTTQSVVTQNLYVKSMDVIDGGGADHTDVYNIGFLQGVGNIDSATGVYLSGAQQPVQLVYANTSGGLESDIAGMTIQPAKSATICLTDGGRYAEIFIGGANGRQSDNGNNNQLNISVQQLGTTPCP